MFSRHSWAIGLLEARGATGPTALRYLDAILGNLRSAGFSIENATHAFWLLDSFVYGHVIQETSLPFSTSEEMTESPRSILEQITTNEYPHLVEIGEHALEVRIQLRQRVRIRPRSHPRRIGPDRNIAAG